LGAGLGGRGCGGSAAFMHLYPLVEEHRQGADQVELVRGVVSETSAQSASAATCSRSAAERSAAGTRAASTALIAGPTLPATSATRPLACTASLASRAPAILISQTRSCWPPRPGATDWRRRYWSARGGRRRRDRRGAGHGRAGIGSRSARRATNRAGRLRSATSCPSHRRRPAPGRPATVPVDPAASLATRSRPAAENHPARPLDKPVSLMLSLSHVPARCRNHHQSWVETRVTPRSGPAEALVDPPMQTGLFFGSELETGLSPCVGASLVAGHRRPGSDQVYVIDS